MKPEDVSTRTNLRRRGGGRRNPNSSASSGYDSMHHLTPLTGRDTEVALLRDRWEQAKEGMGQIVLLMGEAGLGKSRLVRTVEEMVISDTAGGSTAGDHRGAEAITEHPSIVEWRCSQKLQNTGLHAVSNYFRRLLNFYPGESTTKQFDTLASHLDHHGLGYSEKVALFAKLLFLPADERYPPPGLPPARERAETFRTLRQWLRAHATLQPFLFVVEDLHWVDASTLAFLSEFIAEGLHDRILTVLTFRPEFKSPWPAMAHKTSLALNRLNRRQVGELVRKDAGRNVPDLLVSQIYHRTQGVPLLVEEFTRLIRESTGVSTRATRKAERSGQSEIPKTLQELVLLRLYRMSIQREVAQYASVLGHEFSYMLLAAVAPVDEPTLQAELEKLASADILRIKGQTTLRMYQFKHILVEEALHDSLGDEKRRSVHRHVAEVLETKFPQLSSNQPELVAVHFTEAGLIEKATDYWLKAGLRARDQFANIEAINHLKSGLKLLGTLKATPWRESRELELLGPLGTAFIAAHGYAAPEVGPVFTRARTLCERVGNTPQLFAMMRGNFAFHIVRGNLRHCTELAAETVELGEQRYDPGLLMEALFLKGVTMLYQGDFRGAHDCLAKTLSEYDDRKRTAYWATMTGEDSGVAIRCYLALASWHLGDTNRALQMNSEARALARATGQPYNVEYALHHTGWLYQLCRLGAETQATGEEELTIAREQFFTLWRASGTLFAAAGHLLQGNLEAGLRMLRDGLEAYRATGAVLGVPYYLSILAEGLTRAKRFEEARHAIDEALSLSKKNDERFQLAELYRLDGELRLAGSNDQAGAEGCFRRAIDTAQQQESRSFELRATMSLARLWRRQGRRTRAFARLNSIFVSFHEDLTTPDLVDTNVLLSELGIEQLRKNLAAGVKYIRDCIPPPTEGIVSVDWRYVPSSTLGGDTLGYHWVDEDHLALYLIDVTGHGLDSALLSVTINNVIRTGSLPKTDMRKPEQVLARLNEKFPGHQHGRIYFTAWYGVYSTTDRTLSYSSGGHPSAIIVFRENPDPLMLPATGPVMGALPDAQFPASAFALAPGARLLLFSDGAYEIRRNRKMTWNLQSCIAYLSEIALREENLMEVLLARVRHLRGFSQLDDDFSVIQATFH